MGSEAQAAEFFARYDLADVARISDPSADLYREFGLKRGTILQLMGPQVWARGYESFIKKGHGIGKMIGDGFQLPGVFLVYQDRILREFRHQTSADRPDYAALANGEAGA